MDTEISSRIQKIIGQLKSLEERYDARDVGWALHYIASARGALRGLTEQVMRGYLSERLVGVDDRNARDEAAEELVRALTSYLK
jgi:DNA-binding FrmR family transcriptional regulator